MAKTRFSTRNNYKIKNCFYESNDITLTKIVRLQFLYNVTDDSSYFKITKGSAEDSERTYIEGDCIHLYNNLIVRSGRRKPKSSSTYSIF